MPSVHNHRFATCSPCPDNPLHGNGFQQPPEAAGGTARFLRRWTRHASNSDREWMMSLEDSGSTELEPIPLSRRQRRDLVELVAAGVMSAVFFLLPVVMVRDTFASKSVPPPAPEASEAPPTVRIAEAPPTIRTADLQSV